MDIAYGAEKVYALADTAASVAGDSPVADGTADVWWTVLGIIAVMVVGGLLGGIGAYLMMPQDANSVGRWEKTKLVAGSLTLGVVAASLVPVFLQLAGAAVGSDKQLLAEMLKTGGKMDAWFVFAGFCVAAGAASKRFVSAVTKKVLKNLEDEMKAMRTETRKLRSAQNEVLEEVNELKEDVAAGVDPNKVPDAGGVSPAAKKLLETMKVTGEGRVSPMRLAKDGGVEAKQVHEAVEELVRQDFVRLRQSSEDGSEHLVIRPKAFVFWKKLG